MPMNATESRLIVALDYADADTALNFVDRIDPALCRVKVGKELFTAAGPKFVQQLVSRQFDVFLDLKFHDIPNTVAHACRVAADLGVWMLNVHALGGPAMLDAACAALADRQQKPLLIAVTILTSTSAAELQATGINTPLPEMVKHLATISAAAGMDGIVCSAQDLTSIRHDLPADFRYITPGIRLDRQSGDDQQRIMTPVEAIQAGASYLVMGRPVTQSANPVNQITAVNQAINTKLSALSNL